MAITRVNPDWTFGSELTSDQLDGIEDNTTYALDKRSGESDTLASTVSLTGIVNVAAAGAVRANASGAKVAATASGASIEASASGTKIAATVAGALIRTETGGRIELADNDYPTLASGHTGRTVTRLIPVSSLLGMASSLSASINDTEYDFVSPDSAHIQRLNIFFMFSSVDTTNTNGRYVLFGLNDFVIQGATLTELAVQVLPATHGSLPTTKPKIRVVRNTATVGAAHQSLHSAATTIVDPSSTVGVYNVLHDITATLDQNNVVDKSVYAYHLCIANEAGSNAQSSLQVFRIRLTQTITDLRGSL